jgi:hypothetical protein
MFGKHLAGQEAATWKRSLENRSVWDQIFTKGVLYWWCMNVLTIERNEDLGFYN